MLDTARIAHILLFLLGLWAHQASPRPDSFQAAAEEAGNRKLLTRNSANNLRLPATGGCHIKRCFSTFDMAVKVGLDEGDDVSILCSSAAELLEDCLTAASDVCTCDSQLLQSSADFIEDQENYIIRHCYDKSTEACGDGDVMQCVRKERHLEALMRPADAQQMQQVDPEVEIAIQDAVSCLTELHRQNISLLGCRESAHLTETNPQVQEWRWTMQAQGCPIDDLMEGSESCERHVPDMSACQEKACEFRRRTNDFLDCIIGTSGDNAQCSGLDQFKDAMVQFIERLREDHCTAERRLTNYLIENGCEEPPYHDPEPLDLHCVQEGTPVTSPEVQQTEDQQPDTRDEQLLQELMRKLMENDPK